MGKLLIVFPGAGCPDSPLYTSVFALIRSAAPRFGYDRVNASVRWPGHHGQSGSLTLDGALKVARRELSEIEKNRVPYDILARSFGCYVAITIALKMRPKNLRKIILWGPLPFWGMWEYWKRDLAANRKKGMKKGVTVDHRLFPSLAPLESMLPTLPYEVVIATGDQDDDVPGSYLTYLAAIVRKRRGSTHSHPIRFKKAVRGAAHEVTADATKQVVKRYLTALFR